MYLFASASYGLFSVDGYEKEKSSDSAAGSGLEHPETRTSVAQTPATESRRAEGAGRGMGESFDVSVEAPRMRRLRVPRA
jgi:hypothetical protein